MGLDQPRKFLIALYGVPYPHLQQLLASAQNSETSLRNELQLVWHSSGSQCRNRLVGSGTSVTLIRPIK